TRRRHIDHAGVCAGLGARLGHRVEDGQVEMLAAAFARRGAADHLGAVGNGGLRVERAVLAGEALADDLGVLVDQDGHDWSDFRGIRSGGQCPRRYVPVSTSAHPSESGEYWIFME